MNRSTTVAAIVLLLVICVLPSAAQFKDQGLGFGAAFGGTMAQTELRDRKADFMVRGFLRHGLLSSLQGEFGVGVGYMKGVQFRTLLYPIDYRLVFGPFSFDNFNPYIFGGIGALRYDVEQIPPGATPGEKTKDWTAFAPVGIGLQFLTSGSTALEFQGGYNMAFKDNLNSVVEGTNDAYWHATVGLTVIGEGGSSDRDHDGLTLDEELALGTDPHNPDTDGDGLTDGDEVKKYNTNPLKADSDGDGLSDKDEIMIYKTDPNKADTDGDGLSDGDEVLKYHTDPLKADTDGDGLSDGDEVLKYHTDPLKADTDGDGLSDGDEVLKYHTDPLNKDTDGGSVDDGTELARGTDPLNPADDIPKKEELKVEVGAAIVLEGITFETGKSEIAAGSDTVLEKAYNTLSQNPDITVEIRGYTDNTGKKSSNLKLSQSRADAVKTWLVNKGIVADRITAKGLGQDNPIAPNTTKDGRAMNRRIEFFRVK